MSRSDRRTFLTNTMRAGAAVATAGAVAGPPGAASGAPAPPGSTGPGAPGGLTVNGLGRGVGVDPDDLFFAFTLADLRRGARQGSYRITVAADGVAESASGLGLGPGRLGPPGVHRLHGPRLDVGHRLPLDRGQPRTPAGGGARPRRRAGSRPVCARPTGSPRGSGPGRWPPCPRSTPTSAPMCAPRGRPSYGPPRTWRRPTATSCGSTGCWSTRGRPSRSPTSPTTRPPT